MEPISPELVLVDPTLASDDRTWLHEPAWRQATTHAPIHARRRRPARTRFVRLRARHLLDRVQEHLPVLLLGVSLLANGVFTAIVLSESATPPTTVVVTPPPVSSSTAGRHPASSPSSTPSRARPRASSPRTRQSIRQRKADRRPVAVHVTRVAVERRILRLLIQSPAGKLPAALIDPTTGLAKNNLQTVCRPRKRGVYLCLVRPSRHKPQEGLTVRYRATRDGRGIVTWGRYRRR